MREISRRKCLRCYFKAVLYTYNIIGLGFIVMMSECFLTLSEFFSREQFKLEEKNITPEPLFLHIIVPYRH